MSGKGLAHPEYLVTTDWLAAHADEPDVCIFECTVWLRPDPPRIYRVESGRADYEAGHIPNAAFIDLPTELSDPDTKLNFMMPAAERFAAAVSAKGIGEGTKVVLYSRGTVQWATRVWWMLRAMGFDDAVVLDGGFEKWQGEGRPVSTESVQFPPATFIARPREGLFCSKEEVLAAIEDGETCVVNALRAELHDGSSPVNYGRPGRIPNSINIPGLDLIDPKTKAYRPVDELRRIFDESGAMQRKRVMIYCGGGIAATNDAFVLTLLGHDNVTVYDASMTEWANDPSLPMETSA